MADSDADYWLRNRQAILDAIERAGFVLMSNASGFWLHPRGKTDALGEPVAEVNDRYSRDGYNDEISVLLPVGTKLYTQPAAPQVEPKREPLSDERIDEIGEPFGYFQYGDAQGDKRRAFIDRLTRARDEARAERDAMANVLPGHYYMDPPDGGDVPVLEQLRRMAKDAERYRWLRPRFFAADFAYSDPPVCAIVFRWPESAKISADFDRSIDAAMGAGNE